MAEHGGGRVPAGKLALRARTIALDLDAAEVPDEEVLANEARYRALVQHGFDLLAIMGSNFKPTYASPSFETILGFPPQAIVDDCPDLTHPDDFDTVNAAYAEVAAAPLGTSITTSFRIRRADGEYRMFETRLTNLLDDPAVRGIVNNAHDITDREIAFQELRRSEERSRTLLEQGHDLVCVADAHGQVTYLSDSFRAILGWTIEMFQEIASRDLVHPDDLPTLLETARETALGASRPVRVRVRHADGRWRTLDGQVRNLLGHPSIEGIALNLRDVTDEAEALDALIESQRRYRALTERSADLLSIFDADLNLMYASPAHESVLGVDWGALDAEERAARVHSDDLVPRLVEPMQRCRESAEHQETTLFRVRHEDGHTVYLEAVITNRLDLPEVGGLVVNSRDVTDRVEAEQLLREREERFRVLTERSFDLLSIFDDRLRPTYLSPSHSVILGHDFDALTYEEQTALIHPDDLAARLVTPLLKVSRAPGTTELTRFRMMHEDGNWRHLEAVVTNMFDNPAVGGIVVNSRDVTDQVEAERALRLEKDRFHSLIRHSGDVVMVIGGESEITYVSPSIEQVLGRPVAEVIGERANMVQVHGEDVELAARAIGAAAHEPNGEASFECRMRHAQGHWCWMEVDVSNLESEPSVGGLVVHMRDVTGRKRAEQELAHQALHDELTGLPNRSLLLDRLAQALARSRRSGLATVVLFLDLDRFKLVNDNLGHAEGDELLCAVGERLLMRVRSTDTVARLGGDEFVVLLEEVGDETTALDIAHKLLEALRDPFEVGGRDLYVTASMGLALSDDDATHTSMLRDADAAMYEAKEHGRNRLERFDDIVRDRTVQRSRLDHDLHLALERGELRLAYQPAFDVATLKVVGVEALLRWDHPERGEIAPRDFIPIAEENGLIVSIGEWVLDTACAQANEWAKIDPTSRPTVWVNVSARQLANPAFVELLTDTLGRYDLDPALLGLELTESVLIEEAETTDTQLRDIEALGVRLAIDDFGTGYSSLLYLQRFKVDVLKLDRSFVRELGHNLDDHAISSAVIRLGHSLGMEVSAEGVEEVQQLDLLRALGCDVACGFLLARPGPPEDVTMRLWASVES